ncbi:cupin domain-containing protein [Actinoallomurus sp. NBC_01490]|uniref:JmjC domain-containing protein n=1 Tax=Actinoallomurus sp. NBC_01490 TaxID=2903557 RepID=UPI002E34968E|nr:cupin domain-containing protein [Actinoallomurus sp. NBC_01490]
MTALSTLIGDVDEFFSRHLGKAALHRPGAASNLENLISVEDIDRVLTGSALRTPGVRIAKDGTVIPADRYVAKSTLGYADLGDVVDPVKAVRFFRGGATIVLGTVNLLLPHLHALCKDIETDLGHPVDANVYVAPPHARAFEVHCDAQDIIIVQIHGSKRWELFDAIVPNPGGGKIVSDLDASSSTYELREGDVLYVPRGMPHLVRTADASSIHLTLSINTLTWADLLRGMVLEILRSDDFAGALPLGHDVAGQAAPLVRKYADLLSAALADRADADAVDRIVYGRTAFGDGLKTGLFRQALLDTPIDLADRIALRAGTWPVTTDDGRVTVGDTGFRLPRDAVETCRRLRNGPMKVAEISSAPDEARGIASALVTLGLCTTGS